MSAETENKKTGLLGWVKNFIIGRAINPFDRSVFHNISLIAFFAWVGLGADGLSSSCYGPSEAFITLGNHFYLGLIVALATAVTIFVIAESYSQLIELFPNGGGGYYVAGHLLSPTLGMISGAALLIDYMLTITLSVASGADALFSLLPITFLPYKIWLAVLVLVVLIVLNLRGVKESITVLMPIFMTFVITHAVIIIYALATHLLGFSAVINATAQDIHSSVSELGLLGVVVLLLRAYSMGAGTYTGIEAVSNGLPLLREPRVKTAKTTMKYMVVSLALVVMGLMFAYTLFRVQPMEGQTLNAVLFNRVAGGWGMWGYLLVMITLVSEAAILFVASQTGFIGGPRILANMAADRWVPKRFALLSDRLVTMNGILIMGIGAIVLMVATRGNVGYLVVLYSINVFITFCLAQAGMVKHWWQVRKEERKWKGKLFVNGIGLIMTSFILVSVTVLKFNDGGWITLFITGSLIAFMLVIRHNYMQIRQLARSTDLLVEQAESNPDMLGIPHAPSEQALRFDPSDRTAVIFVKNYTGVGLKALAAIFRSFGNSYKNYVFVQLGLIDAGAFRGQEEMEQVKQKVENQLNRYVQFLSRFGYHAEGVTLLGTDTVEEASLAAVEILKKHPNVTFFGGQIIFPRNNPLMPILHNYTLFSIQRRLYEEGIPVFILPIKLSPKVD
ncbi:MAG: APC family permease [Candidatus Margulisiibacteriota bacterium]